MRYSAEEPEGDDEFGGAKASPDPLDSLGLNLKSFKRALDGGDMEKAKRAFKDAVHACLGEGYAEEDEGDEGF